MNSNIQHRINALFFAFVLTFFSQLQAQQPLEIDGLSGQSNYLKTDWGNMYYEVFGEGEPLLILHGNGGSAKGKHHIIAELVKDFQVIAADNRCHGNSDCPTGDLDYFEMAGDVNQLMSSLGHSKYMIWGHSDGGILGLILGYRYTDKVDRMVISGANTRLNGLEPRLVELMSSYEEIPNEKTRGHIKLMMNQREIPMDSIEKIDVPVLLMVGDRDAVQMKHTLDIFEALPQSNLCVLPGTTHFLDYDRPADLIRWVKEFKNSDFKMPSTLDIAEKMAKSIYGEK